MKIKFDESKNALQVMYDYNGMDSLRYGGFEGIADDFARIKEQYNRIPDCWEVQIFVQIPTNVKECQDYTTFLRNINVLTSRDEFKCLCVGVYANSGEYLTGF